MSEARLRPPIVSTTDALQALQDHIGRENGVSAEYLALALGTTERHIRTLITELRNEGIAVCGHPASGYFIAATPEELEATCQFLRSRAMHSLTLESRLRKVSLGELLGQMNLKT